MRRSPFFRRLGCFFFGFGLLSLIGFLSVVGMAAEALGFFDTPLTRIGPFFPVGAVVILLLILTVALGARNLRRLSVPLDSLLHAADRVAEGDYAVRVEERGPPEVRSLTRTFNEMAARLQRTDTQRRDMLADVTHELRTPLTIIQGNLEGMLDGLYPANEERLRSVLEETRILSRLTDDLRTLALADSGTLRLQREPTDLAALLRETAAAFESQANAAGISVELALTDGDIMEIDPERIREVLSNLLANALRYTPRGGTVWIGTEKAASDGTVRIFVRDSGPGIAAEDLAHVFDRYYRARDSGGMGLGLSIARYLVEAHGGQITAENGAGTGTKISFTLGP